MHQSIFSFGCDDKDIDVAKHYQSNTSQSLPVESSFCRIDSSPGKLERKA